MSSRERWTVYPLLFLTLGIAIKDKLDKSVNTEIVVCRTLEVTDRHSKPQVVIGYNSDGGIITTLGNPPNVLIGHSDNLSGEWFVDANGNKFPIAVLPTRPAMILKPTPLINGPAGSKRAPLESATPSSTPRTNEQQQTDR